MSLQTICDICLLTALAGIFFYVEAMPFATKKIKYVTVGGTAAIAAGDLLIFTLFPELAEGAASLFTQTLPALILCWSVSKHKDIRFWFIFCSVDVMGFMLEIVVTGLTILLKLGETASFLLEILFICGLVYVVRQYGREFREIVDKNKADWGMLAVFVTVLYGYSCFLIFYPKPWAERTEYSPVIVGYAVLILLCYVFIVKMVLNVGRMQDMEQEELRMKMQLELQNKELQGQEAKLLLHQMKPHFVYNVLMTIRFFVKKEPQVAYDMLYDFSKYLRSNVESIVERDYILWSDELEHIHTYVRIEEIRLGKRLNVIYDIEDAEFYLPPLTVELLVENAIKHGISPKAEGGTVWLQGSATEHGYQIVVKDDGVGFQTDSLEEEKSVGLNYIRLQMEKMSDASMKLESALGKGTKVTLWFGGG